MVGPISSAVRKNCAPVLRSGTDSVFVNICCEKKFVGFFCGVSIRVTKTELTTLNQCLTLITKHQCKL